ncbi:MAG TPA: DUF885 domain-containing protein [Usitatibacter sp.]|nr:DUF885 domain-containing protein [Usitatibacter sp.]
MRIAFLIVVAAGLLAGCQQLSARTDAWDAFVDEFIEADFAEQPQRAVRMGRHEYDGRLPDLAPAAFAHRAARLHAARDRAGAFPSLTEAQRFERDYLVAAIDGELFWLETMRQPFRNPAYYGFALSPDVYLEREYAPLEQRLRAFVKYQQGIPAAARQARENLQSPMPRTYVQLGHLIVGGLVRHFENDVPSMFEPVKDAALQADLRASNAAAAAALKDFDAWIESQLPSATEDFAMGPARFRQMLHDTERVDTPLEELKAMGERDLQRNLAALKEACFKVMPGSPVKACVDRVQSRKPAQGPVKTASLQLVELRQFILDKHVVSIPSDEVAIVREAPPHQRWNSAYMSAPGPYEKRLPSIFFIAPPDPAWTAAEQRAYIPDTDDLLFFSVHEVWPGHFLQHLHENRVPSKVGRLYRSYAFTEGWAHYAEEMMWEEGLGNGDPGIHVAQIVNALLRDVRYLSAIGLHTGGMTVAQSEAMFRDMAFQDPGNARQQAARGTFDPAYGNYTLGKLMIRQLRDDWTARHGGRSSWQQFHDKLLSYGAPPLPLVRKAMME